MGGMGGMFWRIILGFGSRQTGQMEFGASGLERLGFSGTVEGIDFVLCQCCEDGVWGLAEAGIGMQAVIFHSV